jgi:hypothetical protein
MNTFSHRLAGADEPEQVATPVCPRARCLPGELGAVVEYNCLQQPVRGIEPLHISVVDLPALPTREPSQARTAPARALRGQSAEPLPRFRRPLTMHRTYCRGRGHEGELGGGTNADRDTVAAISSWPILTGLVAGFGVHIDGGLLSYKPAPVPVTLPFGTGVSQSDVCAAAARPLHPGRARAEAGAGECASLDAAAADPRRAGGAGAVAALPEALAERTAPKPEVNKAGLEGSSPGSLSSVRPAVLAVELRSPELHPMEAEALGVVPAGVFQYEASALHRAAQQVECTGLYGAPSGLGKPGGTVMRAVRPRTRGATARTW